MSVGALLKLSDVRAAAARIQGAVRHTPTIESPAVNAACGLS